MLQRARKRAKENGLDFSITEGDVLIPFRCPVLGIPMSLEGSVDNSPSLDRIKNDAGYIKGNVIVVSHRANRMKGDSTPEELRRLSDFYNS